MKEIRLKAFIKLGTALRYLIDASEGQPLGGKHILSNIETVLALIPALEFTATVDAPGYQHLETLLAALKERSTRETSLRAVDARKLEQACRKIRESLITEGGAKVAYYLSPGELEIARLAATTSPAVLAALLDVAERSPTALAALVDGAERPPTELPESIDQAPQSSTVPQWPERLTPQLLFQTPLHIWSWFVGLLLSAFVLGTSFAETDLLVLLLDFLKAVVAS